MDGWCMDRTFFFIGFLFPAILTIAEGSKVYWTFSSQGSSNYMASKQESRSGAFMVAGSHQPEQCSFYSITHFAECSFGVPMNL
jgi:hypothetical protein